MAQTQLTCPDRRWFLTGMTALVTGGTRGIGNAIVEDLASLGAAVHTCSRDETELNQKIYEWKDKGFRVSGSLCDITSSTQRQKLIQTVSSVFDGKLNILVNNVGIINLKDAKEYSVDDFGSIMNTNVESPFQLCQLAHPLLKASGAASIVFVSSLAGLIALPKISLYAASKGAINQLTKNLACEWAKDNIRVNTVAPWAVKTGVARPDPNTGSEYMELIGRTPINRIAEPNEISSLVTFLCLPGASYITAQIISVDGGYSAI